VLLIFAVYAGSYSKYWIHWLSLVIMFTVLLLTDLLFINDSNFVWDPFFTPGKN